MTKVNRNNGNETKWDIFPRDIFKSDIIFISRKILKYFNDFYNWHFSISSQKWAQSSKVKQNHTGHVQIWQYFCYLQSSTLLKWLLKFFLMRFTIKRNWTHLAQKNPGSKIMYEPSYHKNILKTSGLLWPSKLCYVFTVSF